MLQIFNNYQNEKGRFNQITKRRTPFADERLFGVDNRGEYSAAGRFEKQAEQWVNWLQKANNKFHQTYTNRRDDYANAPTFDLKNIRKELDEIFKKICQTADALAILQPSEPLKTFIAKADVSISKWNDVLAQRKGQKGGVKTE